MKKTEIEKNTKEPVNPELEREEEEQAIVDGNKTTLLDKGVAPLSSVGSGGMKF